MEPTSVLARLGGPDGVLALVRRFYERVVGDPHLAIAFDADRVVSWERADSELLAWALSAPSADRERGLIGSRSDLIEPHLRDALWTAGLSPSTVDQVIAMVRRAVTM